MTYHTIQDYLVALNEWTHTLFRIRKGRSYAVINGKEIPAKKFYHNNSKPRYVPLWGDNPDSTRISGDIIPLKDR